MSDLRFDPVTGQWVAIARNRLERPSEYVPIEQVRQQLICPFCRGNEDETPSTLIALHESGKLLNADDDPSSWTVRVVPNKYPCFFESPEDSTSSGPYTRSGAGGAQGQAG